MKVIGMLSVFNDEEIISEVIEDLISQGLELVILDSFCPVWPNNL